MGRVWRFLCSEGRSQSAYEHAVRIFHPLSEPSSVLIRFRLRHSTGNRPYKCTIGECNRTFRDPASASRHKKKCDGEWCSPDSVRGRGKALLRTNEETVVQTLVDPLHHPQYAPLGGSKFYLPQHAFAIHQNQYLTQPPLQTAPPKSQTVALSTDQALDLERMCNRLGLANLRGPQRETATEIPTPPLTASSTDSSPSPSLSDLPPEQLTWIRATQPPFQYQQQHQQSQFGTSNESTRYPFVSSAFSTSPFHSQYMGSTFLPVIQ
jgi:hypothetical protein